MKTIAATVLEPISNLLVGRMRRFFAEHATYADWVSEIPEPMFDQLIREGLGRSLIQYAAIGLVAALAVPIVAWWVAPVVVGIVAYHYWLASLGQCVERECLYRRTHGKWRWER